MEQQHRPVPIWQWVLIQLAESIPLLNILFMLVLAFLGGVHPCIRNYARAFLLILSAIILLIVIILLIALVQQSDSSAVEA
ncbi:hypothetical protein [Rhodothermus marinus]|uniref:Uncharacterized protein n=1 Tax=Rhodothermus marinus (strain ATCC 43812 / DSM 4252 / R-10) TaxID=518766 RepID=D0MDS8_RHOM4|nr:hypothetical protein [Rhodothermus marinus]ACY49072.1 hypothetical protein Rmar_2193 [Rhodothermus marinus DSM 4252]